MIQRSQAPIFHEDDQESTSDADVLWQWPANELQQFAAQVGDGLRHLTDKEKRLSLSAVQTLLGSIPDPLRRREGLEETRRSLQQLVRLPKEVMVHKLLSKMQQVSDQFLARQIAAATESPKVAGTGPGPVKSGATGFSGWRQSDVQHFCAEVETTYHTVGRSEGGKYPTAPILHLANMVPDAVQPFFPEMATALNALTPGAGDMVSNTAAHNALAQLAAVGSEADAFWQAHRGGGSAKSADE